MSVSFDSTEPLSSSFVISNDGYLPVYSVSTTFLVGGMGFGPVKIPTLREMENEKLVTEFKPAFLPVVTLQPGEKEEIPLRDLMSANEGVLAFAHIGARVTYRPLLWAGRRSTTQEFAAAKDATGHFVWYTIPYPK